MRSEPDSFADTLEALLPALRCKMPEGALLPLAA